MCYKIIHGLVALNFDEFFSFSPNTTLRGHPYILTVPLNKSNRSKYFFSSRIVPIWNSLPVAVVMSKNVFSFSPSGTDRKMITDSTDQVTNVTAGKNTMYKPWYMLHNS